MPDEHTHDLELREADSLQQPDLLRLLNGYHDECVRHAEECDHRYASQQETHQVLLNAQRIKECLVEIHPGQRLVARTKLGHDGIGMLMRHKWVFRHDPDRQGTFVKTIEITRHLNGRKCETTVIFPHAQLVDTRHLQLFRQIDFVASHDVSRRVDQNRIAHTQAKPPGQVPAKHDLVGAQVECTRHDTLGYLTHQPRFFPRHTDHEGRRHPTATFHEDYGLHMRDRARDAVHLCQALGKLLGVVQHFPRTTDGQVCAEAQYLLPPHVVEAFHDGHDNH